MTLYKLSGKAWFVFSLEPHHLHPSSKMFPLHSPKWEYYFMKNRHFSSDWDNPERFSVLGSESNWVGLSISWKWLRLPRSAKEERSCSWKTLCFTLAWEGEPGGKKQVWKEGEVSGRNERIRGLKSRDRIRTKPRMSVRTQRHLLVELLAMTYEHYNKAKFI